MTRFVKHKKRGTFYQVISHVLIQAEPQYLFDDGNGRENIDGQHWMLYRSLETGEYVARPISEFEDGRFEPAANEIDRLCHDCGRQVDHYGRCTTPKCFMEGRSQYTNLSVKK